jgi:hypothetical protein
MQSFIKIGSYMRIDCSTAVGRSSSGFRYISAARLFAPGMASAF